MNKRFGWLLYVCLLTPLSAHDAPGSSTTGNPTPSNKLALLIPTLFGNGGLTLQNPEHVAHFDSSFQQNFAPFNTAIAIQLTSLPLPSPASGFTYSFDPTVGAYTRSASSFGPILTERAETIGKDKFVFGLAYQHFNFQSIDGTSLRNLPVVFQHSIVPTTNPENLQDIITTQNFISISLSQWTGYFTYGLSDRIDVSVAIPTVRASMNVESLAIIRRIGSTDPTTHTFGGAGDGSQRRFSGFGTANGIGDVIVRVKGSLVKTKSLGLAVGLDSRMPTGDPYDFLGSGGYGIKPFVAVSGKTGRISPHVNFGFQYNGHSVLAGDLGADRKAKLPNQLKYAVGFDAGITKKFTLSADIIGDQFRASRVRQTDYTATFNNRTFRYPTIAFERATLNLINGSIGAKINPVDKLLVSFNLLYQMNDAGLRARVVPLFGVSYTF